MYQSAEAHPGPSQASKIILFVRIINVFNNVAEYFLPKVPSSMFEEFWSNFWPILTQAINCLFLNPYVEKLFERHQICKLYQNQRWI